MSINRKKIGVGKPMPERKPRSGTILDFGPARRLSGWLRISGSKKNAISVRLIFSSKTGKPSGEK
jgi:hypothetical protein